MNKKISTFLVGALLTVSAGVFAQAPGHGFDYRSQSVFSAASVGSDISEFDQDQWYQINVITKAEQESADYGFYKPTQLGSWIFLDGEWYWQSNKPISQFSGHGHGHGHWIDTPEPRTSSEAEGKGEWVKRFGFNVWLFKHTASGPAPSSPESNQVLIQERLTTGQIILKVVEAEDAPINASLWKVVSADDSFSGKNFTLINKETNLPIVIDLGKTVKANDNIDVDDVVVGKKATVLEGCLENWAWYTTEATDGTFDFEDFYTYEGDNVYALGKKDNGEVVVVKYAKAVAGSHVQLLENNLQFKPVLAAPINLDANGINSMVDFQDAVDGTFKLSFKNSEPKATPFFGTKFVAKDAADDLLDPDFVKTVTTENFVVLENDDKYLAVDAAFYESDRKPSLSNLKFALTTFGDLQEATSAAFTDILVSARFQYAFYFYPSTETLDIKVAKGGVAIYSDADYTAGNNWSNATTLENETVEDAYVRIADSNDDKLLTAAPKEINETYPSPGSILTTISFEGRNFTYVEDYRTTFKTGLYFIKNKENGKYLVANFNGTFQWDAPAEDQNYNNMPATQWVIDSLTCGIGELAITNREFGVKDEPLFKGQLYEKDYVFYVNPTASDVLDQAGEYEIVAVTDEAALTDKNHGYKYLDANEIDYTQYYLHYNQKVNSDLYLNITDENFFAAVEGLNSSYELIPDEPEKFGYVGTTKLKELEKTAYTIKVKDVNLIDNDKNFIALVEEVGKPAYYKVVEAKDATKFYLKSDQVQGETEYYVLIDLQTPSVQAHVEDGTAKLNYTDLDNKPNDRASAFTLSVDPRPKYLSVENGSVVKIYRERGTAKEFLFEDGHNQSKVSTLNESFGYLGVTAEGLIPVGENSTTAIYLDSVVNSNPHMPQYLFVLSPDSVKDGKWHGTKGYNYLEDACTQCISDYNGYLAGRFLVNLEDSTKTTYKFQDYTRFGYVEGVHRVEGDKEYLYIVKAGNTLESLTEKWGVIEPKAFEDSKIFDKKVLDGSHKNYAFSFRLTEDIKEALSENPILLESNGPEAKIGGFEGGWLKVHNNVPVVAKINYSTTGHDDESATISELINQAQVLHVTTTDELPVANKDLNVNDVQVIAGQGSVVIYNGANKSVVVTNILGQTIASTVLTSDEVSIVAPKGIVVVAVQGEKAVKAIVK
ncbi:DUF6383 domain-containing protein [Massilibacteroides sp.]|uniref:DUF6383 domain-containing protein n=1 Tax=Massilibacteroides sp. TaxID=2034766 RepID=UPI0026199D02|nr:DUF6383 domain-containing protein [Massilibacteroides sp.]MDD4514959.1 DUF6383 domain-containing protein [Massilibacteroides sp.]